jgi:hypothetical protein
MKYSIDSSDDEAEQLVFKTNNIAGVESYADYILKNLGFETFTDIQDTNTFKLKLGIFLHNFADRIFKNSKIHKKYLTIKKEHLGLDEDKYNEALNAIKDFLSADTLTKLGIQEEMHFEDKEYKQLFNYIFNEKAILPKNIINKLSKDEGNIFRQKLLEELQRSKLDLNFLKNFSLKLDRDNDQDASDILAFSQIVNRNNKNNLKYLKQQQVDHSTSSVYNIPSTNLGTFTDAHRLHYKTANVQSEIFEAGTYAKDFLPPINSFNEQERLAFIKHIFTIVQHGIPEEIDRKISNIADQLLHLLFITEIQRNVTTLFTAPMFLELVVEKGCNEIQFPMSMDKAVARTRNIIKKYQESLPNNHCMDFDTTSDKYPGDELLIKIGEIFIKWLSIIKGKPELEHTVEKLALANYLETLVSKDQNQISLKDIRTLILDLQKIPSLNDLLSDINCKISKDITMLQFIQNLDQGNTKQFINFYKEKTLKTLELPQYKEHKQYIKKAYEDFIKNIEILKKNILSIKNDVKSSIKNELLQSIKYSIQGIDKWYKLDLDLEQLLKAGGDKNDEFDPDIDCDKEMVIEKSRVNEQKLSGSLNKIAKEDGVYQDLDPNTDILTKKFVTDKGIFSITRELNQKEFNPNKKRESKEYDKMLQRKREKEFSIEEKIYNTILEHREKISNPNELYNIFAGKYQYIDIVTHIKSIPGYYDDNEMFARIIQRYIEECSHSLKGSGEFGEEKDIGYINSYFGKYTLDELDYILHFRINDLQLKDVKILQSIFIEQDYNNISNILAQILTTTEQTTLVPLNLFNKHAVGLIFERNDNGVIKVKYLDSLNKHIPQELKQLITHILGSQVDFHEIPVEEQKYANCGPEVVENFILYLTGNRVSQEKAIELHSKLVENSLLDLTIPNTCLLFEQSNYDKFQPDIFLSGNHNEELSTFL